MRQIVTLAVLLGCGAFAPAFAAPGQANDLQQFLAKRFKPYRGVFGAIASVLPGKLDPNSIAGMEGLKPDGSYWTSVFFNRSNFSMFDDPRNALAKFCASSGGMMKRLRGFDLSPKRDLNFVSVRRTDASGEYLVSDEVVGRWAASLPDGSFARQHDPYFGSANYGARSIDGHGSLGLFSCVSGTDLAIWNVAILPTTSGAWNRLGDMSLQGDAAVVLSVREVDRAAVDRVQATLAVKRQAEAVVAADAARREVERAKAGAARAAEVIPKLQAFQSSVKMGDDTSCGLVLDVRGALVEVQVPPSVKLENGATRLFVKRTMLAPVRNETPCYEYSSTQQIWTLAAETATQLTQ